MLIWPLHMLFVLSGKVTINVQGWRSWQFKKWWWEFARTREEKENESRPSWSPVAMRLNALFLSIKRFVKKTITLHKSDWGVFTMTNVRKARGTSSIDHKLLSNFGRRNMPQTILETARLCNRFHHNTDELNWLSGGKLYPTTKHEGKKNFSRKHLRL